jgi:hypothetical protein
MQNFRPKELIKLRVKLEKRINKQKGIIGWVRKLLN